MPTSWSNWSGSVTCQPQKIVSPHNEAALIALVKQANVSNQTIRVVGTGHSFVPLCASDGILVTMDTLQGVVSADHASLQATVWGGSKIHQLGEPLRAANMAMENMGDIDRQAIAGAISTGTHGTGRHLGSISTQVIGLRLVLASGEVLEISEDIDNVTFKAAQVSLGALGIISQVTLQLQPAYRLHEKTAVMPFDECFASMGSLISENRHFEFFWLPQDDACAVKTLNPTDASPDTVPDVETKQAPPGTLNRYVNAERIDHSDRIFPSERNNRFNEMEFAVPAERGADCLLAVRALMQSKYSDIKWPIEYRTVAADNIFLSPAYGRDTVTLSIHQGKDLPYEDFFMDAEQIFRSYDGRPHWGKMHSHTASELQALYPQWAQFQAVRTQLDPSGRFLNGYLQSIFG